MNIKINETIDSLNRFHGKYTIAERFVVYDGRPEEKAEIESYYRERQHASLGMGLFKELPKSRSLVISWYESITLVDNELNRRGDSLKEYEIRTTVYVRELEKGEK